MNRQRTLLAALPVLLGLLGPTLTLAADIEAGRTKVQAVCSACHGQAGVSVSDSIPNLAAQRPRYLEAQLRALKEGTRKNAVMNAIASQLSAEEIANVAAYFGSLPGAPSTAVKSDFMPSLAKSAMPFPEGYRSSYTMYKTMNFPATRQVRYFYANETALKAAREGRPVPDGASMLVEVHSAKLDADNKPVMGADGYFVPDQLIFYTGMAREAGWGRDVPEMLRNEDWAYAVFTTARQHRPGVNQAECLACHKPLDKTSYLFTLDTLSAAAKAR